MFVKGGGCREIKNGKQRFEVENEKKEKKDEKKKKGKMRRKKRGNQITGILQLDGQYNNDFGI